MDPRTKDAIAAVVEWWASFLREGPSKHDPGFRDDALDRTLAIRAEIATSSYSEEQIAAFSAALTKELTNQVLLGDGWVSASVDYGPDYSLREALLAAQIKGNPLPWKSIAQIEPAKNGPRAYVVHGYGADPVVIWPREDAAYVDG